MRRRHALGLTRPGHRPQPPVGAGPGPVRACAAMIGPGPSSPGHRAESTGRRCARKTHWIHGTPTGATHAIGAVGCDDWRLARDDAGTGGKRPVLAPRTRRQRRRKRRRRLQPHAGRIAGARPGQEHAAGGGGQVEPGGNHGEIIAGPGMGGGPGEAVTATVLIIAPGGAVGPTPTCGPA